MTPRISRSPDGVIDLVDRQLTRATTDSETHGYYTGLLNYIANALDIVKSVMVAVVIAAITAFVVFGVGIGALVYLTGMPLHVAVGVGLAGSSVSTMLGSITAGRYVMRLMARFKPVTDGSKKSPPADLPGPPPDPNPV